MLVKRGRERLWKQSWITRRVFTTALTYNCLQNTRRSWHKQRPKMGPKYRLNVSVMLGYDSLSGFKIRRLRFFIYASKWWIKQSGLQWLSISPTIRLCVPTFFQANNKETTKALHCWPYIQSSYEIDWNICVASGMKEGMWIKMVY